MQPQDLLSIAIAKIAWAQATSGDRVAAVETFRKAWQSAQSIAHTSSRRIALMGLAEMEADAGDHAGAARTLQEVRTLVAAIADNGERDRALIDVAAMQAGVKLFVTFPNIGGLFEGESTAFPAALAATPRSLGSDGLAAPAARPQGDPEAALDTALAIADPLMRFQALKLVAAPALAAGDRVALLPPLRVAQAALVESQKAGVQPGTSDLYDFLLMCVLAGEMDRPLAAAKRMAEDGWPPYLLANIAWVQAQMGDKAAANSTLQDLLTSSLARLDPRARDGMRAYLAALVEANIGDMAAAQASANRIPRVRERTALLVAIATQQPPPEYDKWMLMNFSE